MTDLVLCLSDEKSLSHLKRLAKEGEWERVFVITNDSCRKNLGNGFGDKPHFICVDFSKPVAELIEDIEKNIKGRFSDFEVALNIVSGSGKEHMAILAALLRTGVGIRLVAVTKDGISQL